MTQLCVELPAERGSYDPPTFEVYCSENAERLRQMATSAAKESGDVAPLSSTTFDSILRRMWEAAVDEHIADVEAKALDQPLADFLRGYMGHRQTSGLRGPRDAMIYHAALAHFHHKIEKGRLSDPEHQKEIIEEFAELSRSRMAQCIGTFLEEQRGAP